MCKRTKEGGKKKGGGAKKPFAFFCSPPLYLSSEGVGGALIPICLSIYPKRRIKKAKISTHTKTVSQSRTGGGKTNVLPPNRRGGGGGIVWPINCYVFAGWFDMIRIFALCGFMREVRNSDRMCRNAILFRFSHREVGRVLSFSPPPLVGRK